MARTIHKLVKPENWVWLAAGTGALVDLRTGVPHLDDSASGASWGAARTVHEESDGTLVLEPAVVGTELERRFMANDAGAG